MNHGLSEETVGKIRAVFARFPAVEKAVLYGSRAKGNFKPGSDIDLTLSGEGLTTDVCSTIAESLDDLLLPYTIDLSVFEELNHAKLREHIERVGVVFYEPRNEGQHQRAAGKEGWQLKSVGDILQLEYGKPIDESDRRADGRFPVYGANGEKARTDKFYHDKPSIIVGRKGSAGEINLTERKFWPLDVTYFVTFDEQQHDLQFLYYLLATLELPKLAKGVKPGINRNEVYSQTTRVPELAEQQRIVGLLDEAFEGLATAKANAEKNLQNARALFESHLQSVFTQRGPGWVEKRLKALTTKIGSGATPRGGGESYKAEGVSLIRSLNVHDMGFRYEKLAFLDDAQADGLSNVVVQPRDVLLNITGASVARCCLAPEDVMPARVNQHVSIVRPIADKLDAEFLHYLLISKPYKDQLLATGEEGGSTRQAITKAQIQEFAIEYPDTLKEQRTIVSKLDSLREETQRLAHLYERKLAALEALKKSLLHQAFSGEL